MWKEGDVWGIYLKCREIPALNVWNSFVVGVEKQMSYPMFGGSCKVNEVEIRGLSYKASTIVNYDSRVVPDLIIPHITNYDSRVVIFDRRAFIRLTTALSCPLIKFTCSF